MKILLFHPEFPRDTFWSFDRALSISGRRSTMPPLGLLTVAGFFPTDRYQLSLADENLAHFGDDELRAADLVLASAMIVQRASLSRLIDRCERLGVPIVIGGPLVSACYEELLGEGHHPSAWFIGEAEQLLPTLIEDLEAGALQAAYAHVTGESEADEIRRVFGRSARIRVGERPSLDEAPLPRFDLLELDAYHSVTIQASRGCPIGCEFCDIWKQFGLKSRTASPRHVVRQLSYLFSLGWRGRVFVVDDNFIGNVGAARSLLPALREWQESEKRFFVPEAHRKAIGVRRLRTLVRCWRRDHRAQHPFAFCTEADVRLGSTAPKMTSIREQMVSAGFNSVFLGIETPSTESLREAGKRVNIGRNGDASENLLECVDRIHAAGMQVMSGFIIGFDHDPADIDRAMIDFIERSGIPLAMVGLLAVAPGSALEERLTAEGRLIRRSNGDQTRELALTFLPKGRSERQVVDQYVRVLQAIYGGNMQSYYRRCERTMAALPAPPKTGDKLGWRELRAVALSLVHVRPRLEYMKFLARTLVRRPRFIGLAVVQALQGAHFHELTLQRLAEYSRLRSRESAPTVVAIDRVSTQSRMGVCDAVAS